MTAVAVASPDVVRWAAVCGGVAGFTGGTLYGALFLSRPRWARRRARGGGAGE